MKKAPKDFPEPLNRKKRKLEVLEIAPPPPPKAPTKEEIKAIKKRDHQILNLLKIQIQPIMDQIHRKYKKFRTPVIAQSQLQYLYDEKDPDYVRPDVPQFRPFELDTDKDGVRGLRETATGKFFYNLETTTIEERLSNGFYCRPKDFLADIRSLAKDAKHIGDKERTLKANELLSNVEVDIASIEATPAFADCEGVYLRQLQRTREKEEKQKKQAMAEVGFGTIVRPDPTEGPLTLGETIPGSAPISIMTPLHSPSKLSNGTSLVSQQNGSSTHADVQMSGMDAPKSLDMNPPGQQWSNIPQGQSNPSAYATGGNTQISQKSIFQEIPHDLSPSAIINDASTTESGKKTSDGWSTQATNGVTSSSPVEKPGGDSQLPDTQGNASASQPLNTQPDSGSSEEQWLHSQAHGLARGVLQQNYGSQTTSSGNSHSQHPMAPPSDTPSRNTGSRTRFLESVLNDSPVEPLSSQASTQKEVITCDNYFLEDLLRNLTKGSSGCSVEQLEQINRELMEKIWEMRGEYNRNTVAVALGNVFNETIADIESAQMIEPPSQPSQQTT